MNSQLTLTDQARRAVHDKGESIAIELRRAAGGASGNETALAMVCDRLFGEFAESAQIRWEPEGERRVVWQDEGVVRRGRIDRLFRRVVVEYEAPGSLYPSNEASTNRRALTQTRNYVRGLVEQEGWAERSVAGVVTDGMRFIFCRFGDGRWIEEAPLDTNASSVKRFLRLLLTFYRPPLLPEALLDSFGAQSETTVQAVRALYGALQSPKHRLTDALFAQWEDFFADIAGLDPRSLADKQGLTDFARRIVGGGDVHGSGLLFALYTYSALLIKLIAVAAVTPYFDPTNPDRLSDWAMLDDESLLSRLNGVESGRFFEDVGVRNFTEGDFFGWYRHEWSSSLSQAVRRTLQELAEYDPAAVEQAPERARDLLKRLYHGLFPREVRHDLGEYYTPDWLAERLLAQLDNEMFGDSSSNASSARRAELVRQIRPRLTTTRFLDPTCGSGTFLVLIIRRLRMWARECGVNEREQLLPAILENVVGFDLNPLAVISARANILLSISDLLQRDKGPVELPIYLADSIVLPAEGENGDLFESALGVYRLPLRGVGKSFTVPIELSPPEKLNDLARILRHDVEIGTDVEAFLRLCQGTFLLSAHAWMRCVKPLRELFLTLRELHDEGRNGLWADIARNMFMPLFVDTVDYVVGNPPWVNWESLPEHYRERSKELWQRYGLFVHSGMDTILGKGKKDVSTLLTYAAAERYLKTGGRIGFVITQSVFKTSAAGQGFRRFQIGDDEPLQVLGVDDFSALQPFEGATNRTAVFIAQKGQPTSYPVNYNVWTKRGRASVPFTANLEAARPFLTMKSHSAEPVDASDPTSAWISAPRAALSALRKVRGSSAYQARAGAYSGGANAVYWLRLTGRNRDSTVQVSNITEGAKREIEPGIHTLESDLLYPLLRGRDVKRWTATADPSARFLITQDPRTRRGIAEAAIQKQYPRTFAYLKRYEDVLRQRAALKRYFRDSDAFYSMFNVAEYTFAPYKVVWAEVATKLSAAVTEPTALLPTIPDHTVIFVPCESAEEAYYLCGILNSAPAQLAVQQYIVLHPDPHVLTNVVVASFDERDPVHTQIAALARRAHSIASAEIFADLNKVEEAIDELSARLWGVTPQELAAIRKSLNDTNG